MATLKINTAQTLINDRAKITRTIADFWNKVSEGWRTIWGPHIHHGYYEEGFSITPLEAQEKLIAKLVEKLDLAPHSTILDVGCGMGGSSLYLAKKHAATVIGITLSQKQMEIAARQAAIEHVSNVSFHIDDALSLKSIPDNSVDIVWSLESCEQFQDKDLFFQQVHRVLKPNGKLMLATWCSDQEEYTGKLAKEYQRLCLAFDLPYMPTIENYRRLLGQRFNVSSVVDWTSAVEKSWDIGISLLKNFSLLQLFKMGTWRGLRFAKQVKLMRNAFCTGRVKYGVFVVVKS